MEKMIAEMLEAGKAHAEKGGKLVPTECKEIDRKLFLFCKPYGKSGFGLYKIFRGAFNAGWEKRYFEMTGAVA
jgi:hypothetical protein